MGKHLTSVYWAERALIPEHGYVPVDHRGRCHGFVVCLPENREAVCAKRRKDYNKASELCDPKKLPIWC